MHIAARSFSIGHGLRDRKSSRQRRCQQTEPIRGQRTCSTLDHARRLGAGATGVVSACDLSTMRFQSALQERDDTVLYTGPRCGAASTGCFVLHPRVAQEVLLVQNQRGVGFRKGRGLSNGFELHNSTSDHHRRAHGQQCANTTLLTPPRVRRSTSRVSARHRLRSRNLAHDHPTHGRRPRAEVLAVRLLSKRMVAARE